MRWCWCHDDAKRKTSKNLIWGKPRGITRCNRSKSQVGRGKSPGPSWGPGCAESPRGLVSPYGSTISLVQVLWYAFALCTLALVACSRWFWGSEDSIFVHSSIVHEHWGASSFLFRTLALDLHDCFSPLWRCLEWFHLFAIFGSSI